MTLKNPHLIVVPFLSCLLSSSFWINFAAFTYYIFNSFIIYFCLSYHNTVFVKLKLIQFLENCLGLLSMSLFKCLLRNYRSNGKFLFGFLKYSCCFLLYIFGFSFYSFLIFHFFFYQFHFKIWLTSLIFHYIALYSSEID